MVLSGFTISLHSYTQLGSLLVELLLFSAVVSMQFVTAAVSERKEVLLVVCGGLTLLASVYFVITNGLARPQVRQALICRPDDSVKQRSPGRTSDARHTKDRSQYRRNGVRYNDEMNLDYISSYLGNPLQLYKQEQQDKKLKGRKGGGIFTQLGRATTSYV